MMTRVANYDFYSVTFPPKRPDADALPLLLLHGFMGCAEDFAAVAQELNFSLVGDLPPLSRLCALDLPGHGQTQLRNPAQLTHYGMAETARGVWQWTQMMQPGPWAIAGYSMGGRLALYLAAHFPESFPVTFAIAASAGLEFEGDRQKRKIVDEQRAQTLEHCSLKTTSSNGREGSLPQTIDPLTFPAVRCQGQHTLPGFEAFLKNWYQMPLFSQLMEHPNGEVMLARRRRNNPQYLAHSLRHLGLGQQPFLLPALRKYSGDLHLIVGEHDGKFLGINQAIAHHCPKAKLTVIPNSGHTIPLENPTALAQVLMDGLLEHS